MTTPTDPPVVSLPAPTRGLLDGAVRVAFLGGRSTEDQPDPRQSMLRQLTNCQNAIPDHWVPVAHFYDVESARHTQWSSR